MKSESTCLKPSLGPIRKLTTTPLTRNAVPALAVLEVLSGFFRPHLQGGFSVQVLRLHIAGLTSLPSYRKSRCHKDGALLNDLHPSREGEGRRGRVYSRRMVVWAHDCPTRRSISGIVPLSGVRVEFIGSSLLSSLRRGSDDGELVPYLGPSLRWGTSDRGPRRKGRKGEQRKAASARNDPDDRDSLRLEEPGDRSVHRRPRTRTEGIQRGRCEGGDDGGNDGGFDGFGFSDRSATCPEPLGELRRASRTPFKHCGTTNSEPAGSGCLGTLDAMPAMPLTLFVVVVLSTDPEASRLTSLMVAQEPTTTEEVPVADTGGPTA
jgi:hypothetical protein